MNAQTRDHLHNVLSYMLESEAKSFWRCSSDGRTTWAYDDARKLMRQFEFHDLVKEDEVQERAYRRDMESAAG